MAMMDFMALSKALPELLKMAPRAEEFFAAWLSFMDRLGRKLDYSESKLESLDNRTVYIASELDKANERLVLLMAETNLTPELHHDALMMASADPRNRPDLNGVTQHAYDAPPS
jgi:hypothetical protein